MPCRLALIFAGLLSFSVQAVGNEAFSPANATIEQLRLALDAGQVNSEQLVRYYLDRIERFDKKGPHINALISLNPNALEQARRLDAEAKNKPHKGFLYGIPLIAKDNYDTVGLATSGGSAALRHSVPSAN